MRISQHVRRTIKSSGGTLPERLPLAEHIKEVRRSLVEKRKPCRKLRRPPLSRRLPSDFLPLLRRQCPRPRRPAQFPKLRRRGRRGCIRPLVLFLAGRDPHHAHRVAYHVGGALLASGAFGHAKSPFRQWTALPRQLGATPPPASHTECDGNARYLDRWSRLVSPWPSILNRMWPLPPRTKHLSWGKWCGRCHSPLPRIDYPFLLGGKHIAVELA